MKLLATATYGALLIVGSASAVLAQSTAPRLDSRLEVTSPIARPATQQVTAPFSVSPLSALAEDAPLFYYNADNGTSVWPLADTLLDANGDPQVNPNGSPYIRFMAFERFTSTAVQPYLDSVRLVFYVESLGTHSGNKFVLQVVNQQMTEYGSNLQPDPNINATLRSVNISTSKMHVGEIVDTVIKFKPALKLDMSDTLGENKGSFFVGLSIYYPDNHILMLADSTYKLVDDIDQSNPFDPEVDRSYYVAFSADNQYYTRGFLGGRYYTDADTKESIYYPNYIMEAHTHDAGAGVTPGETKAFALAQNFPNSVGNQTTIGFTLANAGAASLKVYNSVGQEVASLVDGPMGAGEHQVTFEPKNLPNGTYFYTLRSNGQTATRSMSIQK